MTTLHSGEQVKERHWIDGKKRAGIPPNSYVLRDVPQEETNEDMPSEAPMLPVPRPFRDYNLHMGGSDRAAQQLVTYAEDIKSLKYWFSLLRFYLSASAMNSFRLWQLANPESKLTHYEFQSQIALELMRNPEGQAQARRRASKIHISGSKKNSHEMPTHSWLPYEMKSYCKVCEITRNRPSRPALGAIDVNIVAGKKRKRGSQTYWGCTGCPESHICRTKECWSEFHSANM
jgi:hypothetical protein